MYFPDRGCVRPLRHFYGYATAADSNLIQRETFYRCPAGLAAVRVCLQSADGSPDDNVMCIEFHQFHAYSYSAPDGGARSIVMSVSVCLCVCVCVCVCLSVRDRISGTTRPIFTEFFMHVTYGRDSALLWRRSDMLPISGFVDDVIFAHKLRPLDVAARLRQ